YTRIKLFTVILPGNSCCESDRTVEDPAVISGEPALVVDLRDRRSKLVVTLSSADLLVSVNPDFVAKVAH
ncbi:hypothetical protein SARC_17099, partial [Sphaeroforma arctica JP610]